MMTLLAATLVPGIARSAEPCPVTLLPADADESWQQAVAQARARLAAFEGPNDCRSVELVVRADGSAALAFLTQDGRGAARSLGGPSELVPTLDALLVTLPEPSPRSPDATDLPATELLLAPQPKAPLLLLPAEPVPVHVPPSEEPPVHLLLALTGGARLAFVPESYVTPAIALRPSVTVGPWEFGVLADLSPWYEPLAVSKPPGLSAWSLGVALAVGRRECIDRLALGYGLTIGVATTSFAADEEPGATVPRTLDLVEARVGALGRLVYPTDATARFVLDLGFDTAVTNLRHGTSEKRGLPDVPRLGLALAPGIEVSVL